jgi:putative ABC transport system permease protein
VRLAVRRLRATPLFTLFATLSLALAIGVTTAAYSVIDSVWWRPLGIPEADTLVVVTAAGPASRVGWRAAISQPDFQDLRAELHGFSRLAASEPFYKTFTVDRAVLSVQGEAVSGDYFPTVGVRMFLGRPLVAGDDNPQATPVIVLSYDFWKADLGGDASVVGRTVRLGVTQFVVVGVAAKGFYGLTDQPGVASDCWVALSAATSALGAAQGASPGEPRDRHQISVIGRMRPGYSVTQAALELAAIGRRLDAAFPIMRPGSPGGVPRSTPRQWSAETLSALHTSASSIQASIGVAILVLVGVVLAIASTNLANLMAGRSSARGPELAVRRALGASRWRLIREQCAESFIIAMLGGGLAILMARALLVACTLDVPFSRTRVIRLQPQMDPAVLVVAAIAVISSLVVFGLLPALELTRTNLRHRLPSDGVSRRGQWRKRQRLLIGQVAASTALFLIAAICVKVIARESAHDPGFDLPHLAIGVTNFGSLHWSEARTRGLIQRVDALAQAERGFEAVALASGAPVGLIITPLCQVGKTDNSLVNRGAGVEGQVLASTPEVFRTLGIPIIRGRGFDAHDTSDVAGVIVLSARTARELFGSVDVVGRAVHYRGAVNAADTRTVKTLRVIGIAQDTDTEVLLSRKLGTVYVPLAQQYEPWLAVIGRTTGDPGPMVPALTQIVHEADPDLTIFSSGTGPLMMSGQYVLVRIVGASAGALAALGLVLTMVGLYGTLSDIVTGRTRELGVRMALGATEWRIRWATVADGLRPIAWGLAGGLGLGILGRGAARVIYAGVGISVIDWTAFSLAAIPIVLGAIMASYLPARRASRIDPSTALRDY